MGKKLKWFFIILIVILLSASSLIYFYLKSFSNKAKNNAGSLIQPKAVESGEPVNILLLGVDIGTVGSKNSPKRSDTMMVFHYDPKTSDVSVVSIPRDTKVTLRGSTEKINAANAFGGPSLAIQTVENLLGIKINYYVSIDYAGFRKIIDAIGGIDIVIPNNMDYDAESQNLHIHFKKGQQVHLDGEKAEEFVRWRKNNDGSGYADGDLGRIKTQQEFIVKILEKLKSPSNILRIPSIAAILPDYIETNMDPLTMLGFSKDIPKINSDSIQKYTLQGDDKTINGLSYVVYNAEKNKDVVALLGGESSSGGTDGNRVSNKNIKVQILNGSGVSGAATKLKTELEGKGYTVAGTGTISGAKFSSSYIIDKTIKSGHAKQVGSDLDINSIKKDQDTLSKVDVLIIIGLDKSSS
jgi:cell envelope-related function transcriptional attenuator common domain